MVSAGSSSNDIRSTAELVVTGETRVIRPEERAFLSIARLDAREARRVPAPGGAEARP
ncbi:MAG TPA: hypothetical protein VKY73_19050 [Polyangiaceae bacterium]|nr:hypothetical protein [Polyangiaceae bacterium]